jgi:SAM-dependent methyltransferase
MARIENGILGGFNGNLGPVEGYVRYGIAYVRTKKRKRTTPPTPREKIQRKRMEVVNKFVNSMTDYVRIGFEEAAQGKPISPNNAAKSYQLLHAVHGEYPNISINYSAARLTQGTIELPLNPIATAEGNGVRFNWSYNTSLNWSDRGARVMLLVYAEETGKSYYLFSGARMTEETDFLELPAEVKGMQLQVYMSFIADDRRSLSNSIYLGNLVIETLDLNTMGISTEQDSEQSQDKLSGKQYWDAKWQSNTIGWDIGYASPAICQYLDQYRNKNAAILIPGCGNAYEAEYLVENGFTNITLIDISPEAVKKIRHKFEHNSQVKVLAEDFFQHKGQYDLIIEQTFFCAILPDKRKKYAKKTASLLHEKGKIIGLLFDKIFDREGPPFGGSSPEYKAILSPYFDIKTMEKCYNSIAVRAGSEVFIVLDKIQ